MNPDQNFTGGEYYIMYNFDEIIERRSTGSMKYDSSRIFGKSEDLMPLWVADMDFRAPDSVRKALAARVEHGIFGYSFLPDSYYDAVISWFSDNFDFKPERRWIVQTPGVVCAISAAVRSFTDPGDAVIINRPVYYPFSNVIIQNNRKLINSPLVIDNDGHYSMDFDDFEKKITENDVKLYILCSPHNPVGRVWTEEELRRAGEICLKHGVTIVSDEIHCDFVWSDHPHIIFASLSDDFAQNCIICTAPSKTFNLAGLQTSNIFIPNDSLRRRFKNELAALSIGSLNTMGMAACEAAYSGGSEWLYELRSYLRGNINMVRDYVNNKINGIKLVEPEGLYLLWLDMRELALTEEKLEQLVEDAGLWPDGGTMFGPEGLGFQRINIACSRSVLREALVRLGAAVGRLLL